ncbi:phage holin family protein [Rhizobium sp. YIM 134829]|uniref:phage holin family protein n=1 Tax=Rhizobium sp. YIM 134829 TaxID=3390453 RepID=UPI00397E75B4
MANPTDNVSLTELIGGLVSDVSGLLRKEIDLAKTEASEKVSRALGGVEVLLIGLILAIGAVGVLLGALVSGLSALLVSMGLSEVAADAVAALVVGVVIALIAWGMISRGINHMRGSNFKLERTADSLRRDAAVIKETRS